MKLGTKTLTRLAVGAATLALLGAGTSFAVTGCSSDGGADADAGPGGSGSGGKGQPPARPADGPATTDSGDRTFAVNSLKLGGNNEWKKLGYNLDDKSSTGKSQDVCKPVPGGLTSPHQDGDNGIDNSFGANVLESLEGVSPGIQKLANDSLASGAFTIMVQVRGLPAAAPAALTGLSGQLFAGGKYAETADGGLGAPPSFDKTTDWPVLPSILTGSDIASGSKIKFANAYVADGTFVSGDRVAVSLSLKLAGVDLTLSVKNAVITGKPGASEMTDGIISGFLITSEVADALRQVGPSLSESFCGDVGDKFIDTLRTSSDMLSDGTNTNDRECDAISIGLGFTAKEIANPTQVADGGAGGEAFTCPK